MFALIPPVTDLQLFPLVFKTPGWAKYLDFLTVLNDPCFPVGALGTLGTLKRIIVRVCVWK